MAENQIQRFQEQVGTIEAVAANAALVRSCLNKVLRKDSSDKEVDGDYGTIPGCGHKLALHQPGAEKIGGLFNVRPDYEITVHPIESATPGHREVRAKCNLVHRASGVIAGQGVGVCTTMEKKHRFRWSGDVQIEIDPHDKWHTVEAVACKRAFVLAIRNMAACSDIFGDPPDDSGDKTEPKGRGRPPKASAPPPPQAPAATAPKPAAPPQPAQPPAAQAPSPAATQTPELQSCNGKIIGTRVVSTNAKGQRLIVIDIEGMPSLSTWSETLAAQANDAVGEMAEAQFQEEIGRDGRVYRRAKTIQVIKD